MKAALAFWRDRRKMRDVMPRPVLSSLLDAKAITFPADVRRLALARVEQALSDEVGPWQAALRTAKGETTTRVRRAKRSTRR